MMDKLSPTQWAPDKEVPIENPPADHTTEPIDNLHRAEGIPKELFQMFAVDLKTANGDDLTKLKDISTWAMDGQTFVGDGLMKVREMLERLPTQLKDKHNAVWNLITLQRKIDNARKELIDMEKRKVAIYGDGRPQVRPY